MDKVLDPNKRQVGGDHYKKNSGVQHWDWAGRMPYLEGCATKYIARHKDKNGIEDLLKAKHYIDKILAVDYDYVDSGHSLHLSDMMDGLQLLGDVLASNSEQVLSDNLRRRIEEYLKAVTG